ncbi:zinc-binding dehydrogenase [Amycolatopsis sp. GM8]|uniref:zinc-binding dehydrogenase n=1 Tax=Amycolatopsis sp. GM8 TaxID=2896530 RepID=UPI001F300E8D|nr:zinc-binding dehydrogenase [Amycolatopsis sp. GM8]
MTALPTTARAAVLVEAGKPLDIIDVPIPQVEPGAVLVETLASTICATDVHRWEGGFGGAVAGPIILGHEMTGRVVRLGEGVSRDSVGEDLAVGDRIIWAHGFCGQCDQCVIEGQPMLCGRPTLYMATPCSAFPYLTGGFAEYCYVFPNAGRVKVPDEVGDAAAAAAACALRTIVHAFDRLGGIDFRQTVVIQGAGPLGLFATVLASLSGAFRVIVIGGPSQRLDLAREWGADVTIDIGAVPDPAERQALVLEATGGRGGDVVIEAAGVPEAFNEGLGLLRVGGRFLVVGPTHGATVPFRPMTMIAKQPTIIGVRSAAIAHYGRALSLMRRHRDRFDWDALITSTRPLEDINEAMSSMKAWAEIKPAISYPR